jgi:hypothetical protein
MSVSRSVAGPKSSSQVDAARAALGELRDSMADVLDTIQLGTSGRWSSTRPWDLEEKLSAIRNSTGAALLDAFRGVEAHQAAELELAALRDSLHAKAQRVQTLGTVLGGAEAKLRADLELGALLLGTADEHSSHVPPEWVVRMARKLAYRSVASRVWLGCCSVLTRWARLCVCVCSTSAPPDWHWSMNKQLPPPFSPPAPQSEQSSLAGWLAGWVDSWMAGQLDGVRGR